MKHWLKERTCCNTYFTLYVTVIITTKFSTFYLVNKTLLCWVNGKAKATLICVFSLQFHAHRKRCVIWRWWLFALWGLSEPAGGCRNSTQHVQETEPPTQREHASDRNIHVEEKWPCVYDGQAWCGICGKREQGRAAKVSAIFSVYLYIEVKKQLASSHSESCEKHHASHARTSACTTFLEIMYILFLLLAWYHQEDIFCTFSMFHL